MKYWLLIFPTCLFAFYCDWPDWKREKKLRETQALFEEAVFETGSPSAALVLTGGFCLGVRCTDFELEFVVAIPEGILREAYLPLLKTFHRLSCEAGIAWNEISCPLPENETAIRALLLPLIISPNQFPATVSCFPVFGGGDFSLFERFSEALLLSPAFLPATICQTLAIDMQKMGIDANKLRLLLEKRKPKREFLLSLEDTWIEPATRMVEILSIRNTIYPKSVRGALSLLLLAGVIGQEERFCLERFFRLACHLLCTLGPSFSTTSLAEEEIAILAASYPCLLALFGYSCINR